jgi:uncharacterized protein (DUF433 family)
MNKEYVEWRDNGYWIKHTRISLDSVVLAFRNGISPEIIAGECYPALTLEQVYGTITYYLGHRQAIDAYLKKEEQEYEQLRQAARQVNPALINKLTKARHELLLVA